MNRGRDKFNKYKNQINFVVKIFSFLPKSINLKLLQSAIHIRGSKGLVLRYILLRKLSLSCGTNVSIHPGVFLFHIENISFGDNVSIHPMCYIDGAGGIEIGSDVSIAHGVTIMSSEHDYQDVSIPIKDQKVNLLKTVIANDVWIGSKAVILGGISIAKGCIIGAGAVVTKSVPSLTVVAGVPAKPLKLR